MAPATVHMVSLGCAKNRVDSEVLLGELLQAGWEAVSRPEDADLLLVNTCAFIQDATEESIDTILQLAAHRQAGRASRLVVTGCAVQRFGHDLARELPEVDLFLGTGEYSRFVQDVSEPVVRGTVRLGLPGYLHDHDAPRVNSSPPASAYLKISEGCDHRCTYCIIPRLRGAGRSRTISSLVLEARALVRGGVRELNLVAQDTAAFGSDLGDGSDLARLLDALAPIPELRWIRVLYANPLGITDDLLRCMNEHDNICRYLDIPVQHSSSSVLRRMGRRTTHEDLVAIISRIRERVPDIWLRTTLMVGFPGETDADFEEMMAFLRQQRFEHLGLFEFSPEEGTAAYEMDGRVAGDVSRSRLLALQRAQQAIAREVGGALVGRVVPVLVEGVSTESEWLLEGRLGVQAPEVDGKVFITNAPGDVRLDSLHRVKLIESDGVDFIGEWFEP